MWREIVCRVISKMGAVDIVSRGELRFLIFGILNKEIRLLGGHFHVHRGPLMASAPL